jgi:tryptophan synthase alpha chain
MSDLHKAFDHGKAFIGFVTCGDPNLETTGKVVKSMVANGADLIELGIPFSDPTAEGPVIMGADKRALDSGVTTDDIFEFTKELRKDVKVPMLYMTYANVVFHYGVEEFCRKAEEAGVSGLILPDVPFEEKGDFESVCLAHNIDLVSMVAPTSEDRVAMIAREAKGFVYIVSSLGVTGVRSDINTDLQPIIDIIRKNTDIPCAIGFGISNPDQCRRMAMIADGAIVGSGIVRIIEKNGKDSAGPVGEFVRSMKDAIKDL